MKELLLRNRQGFLYLLFTVLLISIFLTNVLHNDVVDTILTIFNTGLITTILYLLAQSLVKSLHAICNPH